MKQQEGNLETVSFEDFKHQNGIVFWWASDLMGMLGYSEEDSAKFRKSIDKATKACISLNIDHYSNIIPVERDVEGGVKRDYKLTRFACYITVMNSDPSFPNVAAAQYYFAEQTRILELQLQGRDDIDRVLIRDDIKEGNKQLNAIAHQRGLEDFSRFNNQGYLGLYNQLNVVLAKRRGVVAKDLLDHMGRTELAANLFRITQTEERIKAQNVRGQKSLEETHFKVGRDIRELVIANTGIAPENMSVERKLPEVKKGLKESFKQIEKIDKSKK